MSDSQRDAMEVARQLMVDTQLTARGIGDARVLAAMRKVPRHLFVPENQRHYAYDDGPLSIGWGQTISQPYIVAAMTELAALTPSSRVLEIGTGSGYQTAMLAELADQVYSIEILESLFRRAMDTLDQLGYLQEHRVQLRCSDGSLGWPEVAPFDAILVTAAPTFVPTALKEQLTIGGRLIIPVGSLEAGSEQSQDLRVIHRHEHGFHEHSVFRVRFVPMIGEVLN